MNVFKLEESESFFPQITPLVDVVLLVLIFFLITATYSNVPQELKLNLPEAGASDGQVATELRMFLTRDGKVRFRGEWYKRQKMLPVFKKLKKKHKSPVLLISADQRSAHQHLVDLIVQAKQAGIKNFGFEIVLRKTGRSGTK
ncbi:MAG: ExbD/TolR family protein [bacterium]